MRSLSLTKLKTREVIILGINAEGSRLFDVCRDDINIGATGTAHATSPNQELVIVSYG
jgi:hypothetical protein